MKFEVGKMTALIFLTSFGKNKELVKEEHQDDIHNQNP